MGQEERDGIGREGGREGGRREREGGGERKGGREGGREGRENEQHMSLIGLHFQECLTYFSMVCVSNCQHCTLTAGISPAHWFSLWQVTVFCQHNLLSLLQVLLPLLSIFFLQKECSQTRSAHLIFPPPPLLPFPPSPLPTPSPPSSRTSFCSVLSCLYCSLTQIFFTFLIWL